jgi:hypothetical protein
MGSTIRYGLLDTYSERVLHLVIPRTSVPCIENNLTYPLHAAIQVR